MVKKFERQKSKRQNAKKKLTNITKTLKLVYLKKCHKLEVQLIKLQTQPRKKANVIQFEQHQESKEQKKNMMNVKFKRKGKYLSTKMEFIMVFTNFSLASDF